MPVVKETDTSSANGAPGWKPGEIRDVAGRGRSPEAQGTAMEDRLDALRFRVFPGMVQTGSASGEVSGYFSCKETNR